MKYKYHILPAAREEFRLAREWYRMQHIPGLSDRFAQAVKVCINRIELQPFAFAVRYRDVRIAHTERFPYAIHFYLSNDSITITAIIFQGRDPLIAKERI